MGTFNPVSPCFKKHAEQIQLYPTRKWEELIFLSGIHNFRIKIELAGFQLLEGDSSPNLGEALCSFLAVTAC
jgi:hypothetical protein